MKKLTKTDYLVESREIAPKFDGDRYNGGWAKKITGIDRTKSNGYSLIGDFVDNGKSGTYRVTEGCLYLDCDLQGSRKNLEKQFSLFFVSDEKIMLLASVKENDTKTWAIDLWPAIDDFFARDQIPTNPLANISTEDLLAELARRKK